MKTREQIVVELAKSVGFDLVGISDASVLIGSFNLTNLYYIFVIGLVCLYVWQGYDAYSTAVKENRAISNTTRQQSESY